jgi:hypothetical protein
MKKYHHFGIPTKEKRKDEIYIPHLKLCIVSSYEKSQYGIELIRFDTDASVPELLKTVPHVAFKVDDIANEIKGKKVLLEPYFCADNIMVAFIEENGVPVEFLQYFDRKEQKV